MKIAVVLVSTLLCMPAVAAGLDRDTLLTEAPAVPNAGTVRITGGANGQPSGAADTGTTGGVSAAILWAPFDRIAGDVGLYLQGPDSGPTVRVRVQILKQRDVGLDLAIGARFKELGFFKKEDGGTPNGEFEYLLALGKSFGRLDAMLDGVIGFEAGGPGSDLEGKAFVGYRVLQDLRVGADFRLQAEYKDENGYKKPDFANDCDLFTGAAGSLLVMNDKLQLQALLGIAKPKGSPTISPGGLLAVSLDF
jgi:hypothetical protein